MANFECVRAQGATSVGMRCSRKIFYNKPLRSPQIALGSNYCIYVCGNAYDRLSHQGYDARVGYGLGLNTGFESIFFLDSK